MDVEQEARRQLAILRARSVDLLVEEELYRKLCRSLRTQTPLRVKLGLDPTAPDLHIGHMVVIHKLREFQVLGHDVIFLIGDFTGMIGDPSGRSETRKPLTAEQIQANAETYKRQIFKILDRERTIIEYNSRWGKALGSEGMIKLAAQYTVARMLERDDFQARFAEGRPISLHEFLYPLLQGYDSVALRADVELGGTDQKFNLLVGRDLMRDSGMEPQVIMTLPILEGLDGVHKMSKSLGNYIGIDEESQTMFGKTMSIPDSLILRYIELATAIPREEIAAMHAGMADGSVNPRDAKARLARALVTQYHSAGACPGGDPFSGRCGTRWGGLDRPAHDPGGCRAQRVRGPAADPPGWGRGGRGGRPGRGASGAPGPGAPSSGRKAPIFPGIGTEVVRFPGPRMGEEIA